VLLSDKIQTIDIEILVVCVESGFYLPHLPRKIKIKHFRMEVD